MQHHMFLLNSLSAVQNLKLILGGIVQLHDIAFRSIEDRCQLVLLIHISLTETGALLTGDCFPEPSLGFAGERSLQRIEGVDLQRLSHAVPREAIVAKDSAL